RFVRRLVRDETVAQEIVQDVVVAVLSSYERIAREWADRFVFRCLRHQVISHWRRERRPRPQVPPPPEEPAPDDALAFTELLRSAMNVMTGEERRVVAAWWDAKGDRQAAMQYLGLPESPGKASPAYDAVLHRARHKLSAVLGPHRRLSDRV